MNRSAIRAVAMQCAIADLQWFNSLPFQCLQIKDIPVVQALQTFVPVCQYKPTWIAQRGEFGFHAGAGVRYKIGTRKSDQRPTPRLAPARDEGRNKC